MKQRLTILLIFLLIHCIASSQDGTTQNENFLFNSYQVRKMYEVKLENDFLIQERITLLEIVQMYDSLNKGLSTSNFQLQSQIEIRTNQYENAVRVYELEQKKFEISDSLVKSLTLKKNIFLTSTIVAGIIVTALALF